MAGELITQAAAIGVAGWFGNKLFGPTAALAGDGLKNFVNDRVRRVFDKASDKLKGPAVELDPGFLMLFCQRASFSARDDNLTEVWAALLADAAQSFANKHVAYVEILSQLGPAEVGILNGLVATSTINGGIDTTLEDWLRSKILSIHDDDWFKPAAASNVAQRYAELDFQWPAQVVTARVPFGAPDSNKVSYIRKDIDVEGWNRLSLDLLMRERLLEEFVFETDHLKAARIKVVAMTALGLDFTLTCRGQSEPFSFKLR